jgi:molybdopterin-dependent oxidoreductase alpha subunit
MLGTGTATVSLEDLKECDLFILIGANPASNHPRLMKQLVDLRRRGGKVVIINPAKELGLTHFRVPSDWRSFLFGSKIADLYLQPHIGGDIALLTGVAKCILESGCEDIDFLERHTEGFDLCADAIRETSWAQIESDSGVPREQIESCAQIYSQSKRTVFSWAMGITHHLHGVNNVRAIGNLALLRGMVGKPGAGLLPLRGHSNVQGLGSVGVVPSKGGYDTLACMEAAAKDEMKLAFCLGGNLFASNPDSVWASQSFSKIDLIVQVNTTLNTGHAHGCGKETLILPALPRDEEAQSTTQESMFNYVRFSAGGKPRHAGPLSEQEIICKIADRVMPNQNWGAFLNHDHVRCVMGESLKTYRSLPDGQEYQIPNRVFHQPVFPRKSGRARLQAIPLPVLSSQRGPSLRLMTVRSEGQFNSVVYEETDLYRGQERRDVVLLHPNDMRKLGLKQDQVVTVKSNTGQLTRIHARPFNVREGNALMYYPEANALCPREVDPESRTPAFKNVSITVFPSGTIPC